MFNHVLSSLWAVQGMYL